MKAIVIPSTSAKSSRKAYAVRRMNIAAGRMIAATTPSEEIVAGHWVLAWAVAAGARPSARSVRDAQASHSTPAERRLH